MNPNAVSTIDMRVIDRVLEMGGGYVLDFVDRTFADFFAEHGVQIDDSRYSIEGTSKAKRLRYFLKTEQPPLTGQILAALLEHRLAWKNTGLSQRDLDQYHQICTRLGGNPLQRTAKPVQPVEETTEAALLKRVFKPAAFAKLPVESSLGKVLIERMQEAERCMEAQAFLSAVILCGSVLEGMCLGFGSRHPERVNRAYLACLKKNAPHLHEWKLTHWIQVLAYLKDLSPNVEKFGHALREFRNYVHPAEQLSNGFSPDEHTARIGFHVVVAAADGLILAESSIAGTNP